MTSANDDTAELAAELKQRNRINLKALPEDEVGADPAPIVVFEQFVLIGDHHDVDIYPVAHQEGINGEIWVADRGGILDPGTLEVRGIPTELQDQVAQAIKAICAKKIRFVA
jgi:hypothetical protein